MPRKSPAAKAAAVSLLVPGAGRPPPPDDLDSDARGLWMDICGSMPLRWFDAAGQALLRRVVVQSGILRRIEHRLEIYAGSGRMCDDEALALAEKHAKLSRGLAILLRELRATPKSRYVPERSAVAARRANLTLRPWDIRADGIREEDEPGRWQ